MIDDLIHSRAKALTVATGSEFKIERRGVFNGMRHYALYVTRRGVAYHFLHGNVGIPRGQMETFLTTLLNLYKAGLLPASWGCDGLDCA